VAGCKVVTRKLTPWHGRDEEFSNVYYFGDGGSGASPDATTASTLVNMVIAAEKAVSRSSIRFLGGAAYKIGAADLPGDTDAISVVELPATGQQGTYTSAGSTNVYRECAIDLRFLLTGRRYLRTLIHCNDSHGYDVEGTGSGTASTNLSAAIKTFAEKMLNGPWVDSYQRIAPGGARPTVIQYQPFLEHRQFHRYRRRNAGLLG
jgi:hypothetical protein